MDQSLFHPHSPIVDNADQGTPVLMKRHLLYNIFMQVPAILCVLKGPEYIFELANEPCLQLIGHRDLLGKTLREVMPELEAQGYFKILDKVYSTGEPYTGKEMPVSINHSDGKIEHVFLNFNYQAFFDADNNIEGILVFAYDVSEQVIARNKIKESEAKFRNLIYGLPSALYSCDADGYIQLYNEAAVELWGRKPVIGEDLWCGSLEIYDVDGSPLPIDECPMAIALKTGVVINREIIIKRHDGSLRNVIPYPQPMYDAHGKITGATNSLVDITEQVRARKQMQQAAEMIKNLYMNAPAFVCTLKGPEFVYELINPEYQKLYGKRQLFGLKFMEALPELEGTEIKGLMENVYKTGKPYVGTEMLLYVSRDEGKEPEATYFNFSYQPIYNLDKEIDGILAFGYEVTEQVLAKKKGEEDLKNILESLPQITSTSSAAGTNIFFNKFFFDYSGLSKEEASVNGWNSVLHPDEIGNILTDWEQCKQRGTDFYKEIRLKRNSDGMYRWHISHTKALKNKQGEVTQWIATATDIHEQKTKEQKKDEFISIASHELKTPLTSIKAYLQLLQITIEESNEKANLYTKKAIISVDRLNDLISELLDVSKIQHGKLIYNFTNFDFNKMVDEAIEGVQYNSPLHQIIMTGEIPGVAEGDKERLQQVVINLLSNAVKYSPDAKDVFVHIALQDEQVTVSVKDNGIGINKNNLEKIFERYFRVEGQAINFQGLGIGLFISMEIIQQHGGKLWAESEPEIGSTFYFKIPLKQKKTNN